jgi:hypothetical protein
MKTQPSDQEERQAWDQYLASVLGRFDVSRPELAPEDVEICAAFADAALEARRKRFGDGK